ncbi:MAG: succinate-semialdehyde dehydrogenase (NADP(+)) [Flavobacteriaceae bacterium]|nr:succinate-semialdehyde dehydrogenase (NADP(+)) [Flavobacteriaceae bacterium]
MHIKYNKSFIDGKFQSFGKLSFEVLNPANEEILSNVNDGGVLITKKAIKSSEIAFKSWSKLTAKSRSLYLENLNKLILDNKNELAKLITLECGKPINESIGEVLYGASFIKWFAEEGKRTYGEVIPTTHENKRMIVIKQPVGVVSAITPWNFPLAMITRKIAPALAAGCSVIVMPSYETPLTALYLANLTSKAGFPKGVINFIVGKDVSSMGKILCNSKIVKKISFTGSTRVGKILSKQSSSTLKKLSLELGGNAPVIVFDDADIDKAVDGTISSKFRNSGQTCVCVNRIFVHKKIHDKFVSKLIEKVKKLKIGNGLQKDTSIGPMINGSAIKKNIDLLNDSISKGGSVLTGGKIIKNNFFEPTVIVNANMKMHFFKEEIFGPIAPIYKFENDKEVIEMANNTDYGLAAYFFSENISRCWKTAEKLEYGMIGINEGLISTEVAPFGGMKYSGYGREGSKYGILNYLEIKYLCFGL